MLFNRKIKQINTARAFLKCIKILRKLNISVPITESYENTLRSSGQQPLKTWYSSQGEHWQGWLGEYKGSGFYGRKNHKRTVEFIYNHIMCPPMLIWLAETISIDKNIINQAINESLKSDKYQERCKIVRKYISWEVVEKAILERVST